jgi:hypothetical protein
MVVDVVSSQRIVARHRYYTLQLALNTDPALLAFQPTASSVGADDTLDSDFVVDATRSFAEHQFVSPSWGQTDLSLYVLCCLAFPQLSLTCCFVQSDAGFVRRFSIGDLVFLDSNGDGLQAAAEPGIAGVAMRLTRGGVLIATTTTDVDGLYRFESLAAALVPATNYTIGINGAQGSVATLRQTVLGDGSQPQLDSNLRRVANASDVQYEIDVTTPGFGVDLLTFDAGFVEPFGIGDFVFHDVDFNSGLQVVGGVGYLTMLNDSTLFYSTIECRHSIGRCYCVVVVADANRTMLLATTLTDANGLYYFNSWQSSSTVDTTYTISMMLTTLAPARQT